MYDLRYNNLPVNVSNVHIEYAYTYKLRNKPYKIPYRRIMLL